MNADVAKWYGTNNFAQNKVSNVKCFVLDQIGRAGRTQSTAGDAFLMLDCTDETRNKTTGAKERLTVLEGAKLMKGSCCCKSNRQTSAYVVPHT